MFLIDVAGTGRIALLSRPKFASVVTSHYYWNIYSIQWYFPLLYRDVTNEYHLS